MVEKVISKNYSGVEAYFYIRPKVGLVYCDEEIIHDVRVKNCYNLGKFNKDDVVIDIGGHIGSFAIECALRDANVLTFEPDDDNYAMLVKNIEINNLNSKITPFKKIVSEKNGIGILYLDSANPGSHSIYKKFVDHDIKGSIEVESITLNDIVKELNKVILIKLDCEGSEYEILLNSDLSKIEKITMELHDKERNEELVKYLKTNGYKVTWYFGMRLGKLQAER